MFTLGVDFGTNSVRALVVRCSDGAEYGSRVVEYPSGAQGVLLDPKDGLLARQHPGDYLVGLKESVQGALAEAGRKADFDRSKVVGIGVDSTGSSPIPVDRQEPTAGAERQVEGGPQRAVLAVEGSHLLARGGQDHRAQRQAPAAIHRQVRRGLLLGMVLVQALALPECRSGDIRRRLLLGRTRRLDSLRARRRRRSAIGQTWSLPRGPQGALFRRLGRPAGQRIPDGARSASRRTSRPTLRKGLRRERARRLALLRLGDEAGAPRRHSDRYRRVRCSLRRDRVRRARGRRWSR